MVSSLLKISQSIAARNRLGLEDNTSDTVMNAPADDQNSPSLPELKKLLILLDRFEKVLKKL